MGSDCCKHKTRDRNPPRCAPGEYPKNPAYANQIPAFAPSTLPPPSNAGLIGGSGGNDFIEGAAVGYMLGHGGTGMLSGIDGGPRMAIGGNYVGL